MMDMPEDLEPKGLPVNDIPDCYGGTCSEEDYANCSYAELCREQKEWDDADDCDGGDWPTGETCISCEAWGVCSKGHIDDIKSLRVGNEEGEGEKHD